MHKLLTANSIYPRNLRSRHYYTLLYFFNLKKRNYSGDRLGKTFALFAHNIQSAHKASFEARQIGNRPPPKQYHLFCGAPIHSRERGREKVA
jgi:hypothetical protein